MGWKDNSPVVQSEVAPQQSSWKDKAPLVGNDLVQARIKKIAEDPANDIMGNLERGVNRAGNTFGGLGTQVILGLPAKIKDFATGTDNTSLIKDAIQNLKGNRVRGEEYLKRMGMEERQIPVPMTDYSIPLRAALGGTADFAGDILGTKGAGMAVEGTGNAMRRVPYAAEDTALWLKGKKPLSKILEERGKILALTQKGKLSNIEAAKNQALGQLNAIEAPIKESGATGDINSAMSDAQKVADQLKNSGDAGERAYAEELQKQINTQKANYNQPEQKIQTHTDTGIVDESGKPIMRTEETVIPEKPGPTYQQLLDIKRAPFKNSPKRFDKSGNEVNFDKNVSGGAGKEAASVAESVTPGSSNTIKSINQDLSSFKTIEPRAGLDVLREGRKKPVTQIDLMSLIDPGLAALKQVGKVAGTPAPWTYGGTALKYTGKAMQKGAIPFSVWNEIYNRRNNENK